MTPVKRRTERGRAVGIVRFHCKTHKESELRRRSCDLLPENTQRYDDADAALQEATQELKDAVKDNGNAAMDMTSIHKALRLTTSSLEGLLAVCLLTSCTYASPTREGRFLDGSKAQVMFEIDETTKWCPDRKVYITRAQTTVDELVSLADAYIAGLYFTDVKQSPDAPPIPPKGHPDVTVYVPHPREHGVLAEVRASWPDSTYIAVQFDSSGRAVTHFRGRLVTDLNPPQPPEQVTGNRDAAASEERRRNRDVTDSIVYPR